MTMTNCGKHPDASPMQYASGYTLDLYCDHSNERHGFDEFPHQYTGETFGECAKEARRNGWIIRSGARTATCPKCSGKRKDRSLGGGPRKSEEG